MRLAGALGLAAIVAGLIFRSRAHLVQWFNNRVSRPSRIQSPDVLAGRAKTPVADRLGLDLPRSSPQRSIEAYDLRLAAVQSLEQMTRAASVKGIQLDWEFPPEECTVSGHLEHCRQILISYLMSAIRFSPPGRSVRLSVCRSEEGWRCEVQDQALGLLSSEREDLVVDSPPLSESHAEANVELGPDSSLVKQLAELEGGKVGASSGGSVFWLTLPFPPSEPTRNLPDLLSQPNGR